MLYLNNTYSLIQQSFKHYIVVKKSTTLVKKIPFIRTHTNDFVQYMEQINEFWYIKGTLDGFLYFR